MDKLLEISVVLGETPLRACPLTLFSRYLLLTLVYTSSFLGKGQCQTLARPKNFCLEKEEGLRETKAWRNQVTTGGSKWDKRDGTLKVSKMENQASGGDAVQSTLQSTKKYLKMSKDLVVTSQGLLSGTGCWTKGTCGFTWCCHSYIFQWLKFFNIWLLAKFA